MNDFFKRDPITGDVTIQVTFNEGEYMNLLLMLGFTTGAATRDGLHQRANAFIKLANKINEHNPNWKPYATDQQ